MGADGIGADTQQTPGTQQRGLQQSPGMQQLMPLLTRMPRHRVKAEVITLAPGTIPAAVLRQQGVPVYEVPLSARRFSARAPAELMSTTRRFRPDVIQAWGHTAQIAALAVRARCEWKPQVVWSVAGTVPLVRGAGLIDRQKLKLLAKLSVKPERIVFASEAAALLHRRAGFPEEGYSVIPPGVDATRFKPDASAGSKLREQLQVPADAFVIGMMAPFQPEFDHATLIEAVSELAKTHDKVWLLLAGHGVSKGNSALVKLLGTGPVLARSVLLGEWSDAASFFNACDVACSSAQTDNLRMTLAMAMLCGVPCVATGMGAQGEVLGKYGAALEVGSAAAFVRAITRILRMPPEKRTSLAQSGRKHALRNFVYILSLQKYLQLYYDLVGRERLASDDQPTPQDGAPPASSEAITIPVPPTPNETSRDPGPLENPQAPAQSPPTSSVAPAAAPRAGESASVERCNAPATAPAAVTPSAAAAVTSEASASGTPVGETSVSETSETVVNEAAPAAASPAPAEAPQPTFADINPFAPPVDRTDGDVLEMFEASLARMGPTTKADDAEMARGVAEEVEELLPMEMLQLVESDPPKAERPAKSDAVQLELLPEDERKQAASSG
ncbi:MAG: hypothetical protein DIU71_05235 [Proteobacteria bacterium]|nr:MAG: hypothetical protein DIU71_05235 [Pseudomonadota bacterium]